MKVEQEDVMVSNNAQEVSTRSSALYTNNSTEILVGEGSTQHTNVTEKEAGNNHDCVY